MIHAGKYSGRNHGSAEFNQYTYDTHHMHMKSVVPWHDYGPLFYILRNKMYH